MTNDATPREHTQPPDFDCWCRPTIEVQPNGAKIIIHNERDPAGDAVQQQGRWRVEFTIAGPEQDSLSYQWLESTDGEQLHTFEEIKAKLNDLEARLNAVIEASSIAENGRLEALRKLAAEHTRADVNHERSVVYGLCVDAAGTNVYHLRDWIVETKAKLAAVEQLKEDYHNAATKLQDEKIAAENTLAAVEQERDEARDHLQARREMYNWRMVQRTQAEVQVQQLRALITQAFPAIQHGTLDTMADWLNDARAALAQLDTQQEGKHD